MPAPYIQWDGCCTLLHGLPLAHRNTHAILAPLAIAMSKGALLRLPSLSNCTIVSTWSSSFDAASTLPAAVSSASILIGEVQSPHEVTVEHAADLPCGMTNSPAGLQSLLLLRLHSPLLVTLALLLLCSGNYVSLITDPRCPCHSGGQVWLQRQAAGQEARLPRDCSAPLRSPPARVHPSWLLHLPAPLSGATAPARRTPSARRPCAQALSGFGTAAQAHGCCAGGR